jgi:hypothetical protein
MNASHDELGIPVFGYYRMQLSVLYGDFGSSPALLLAD